MTTQNDIDGALSPELFCALYSIKKTTFYNEVKEGRLRKSKLGRRTLIARSEARRWFDVVQGRDLVAA
jgi:hypothetical protein